MSDGGVVSAEIKGPATEQGLDRGLVALMVEAIYLTCSTRYKAERNN